MRPLTSLLWIIAIWSGAATAQDWTVQRNGNYTYYARNVDGGLEKTFPSASGYFSSFESSNGNYFKWTWTESGQTTSYATRDMNGDGVQDSIFQYDLQRMEWISWPSCDLAAIKRNHDSALKEFNANSSADHNVYLHASYVYTDKFLTACKQISLRTANHDERTRQY